MSKFCKNHTPWNKGKKLSTEHRSKLSKAKLGKKHNHKTSNGGGWKISEQGVENIKKAHNSKSNFNLSPEFGFKKGQISLMKGKHHTEETRKKLSEGMKGRYDGEKHPQWIKDRTLLKDDLKDRGGQLHKDWSRRVKNRDNWKCKIDNCDCNGRIEAHHILSWVDYLELRYEVNNGITLCHAHHPKKRAEEKRLIPTFMELVSVSKVQV